MNSTYTKSITLNFPTRLKECRKAKSLTQQQLAEMVSSQFNIRLSRASIARYEAGTTEPEITPLICMASLLDVDVNYLMGISPRFSTPNTSSDKLNNFCINIDTITSKNPSHINESIYKVLECIQHICDDSILMLNAETFCNLLNLLAEATLKLTKYSSIDKLKELELYLKQLLEHCSYLQRKEIIESFLEDRVSLTSDKTASATISFRSYSLDENIEETVAEELTPDTFRNSKNPFIQMIVQFYDAYPQDTPSYLKPFLAKKQSS